MGEKKPAKFKPAKKPAKPSEPEQLVIPPDAFTAKRAVEVFRAWIIDKGFQCSLHPTIWKATPETWGFIFADAAIHTANALAEELDADAQPILKKIVQAFLSEVREPSGLREGEFVDDKQKTKAPAVESQSGEELKLYWKERLVGRISGATFSDFPWKLGTFRPAKIPAKLKQVIEYIRTESASEAGLIDWPFPEEYMEHWRVEHEDGRTEETSPPIIDFAKGTVEWR